MDFDKIADRGLVLLGCGKMGSAMLAGWLAEGLPASSVWVLDPHPSDWLKGSGVHINDGVPANPAVLLIAVKPQMIAESLPTLASHTLSDTLIISVAAGTPIAVFESSFGAGSPIVRSMPNTPAAIGKGITAIVGNTATNSSHLDLAEGLLRAVGQVVRLEDEAQLDAVTGVSGSGPAYVFHLIETLAAAGVAQGLPGPLAMQLAKATVAGAGALAEAADEEPAQLRKNVTSPNGTTQAALDVLMHEETGMPPLLHQAVAAATNRSKELGRG